MCSVLTMCSLGAHRSHRLKSVLCHEGEGIIWVAAPTTKTLAENGIQSIVHTTDDLLTRKDDGRALGVGDGQCSLNHGRCRAGKYQTRGWTCWLVNWLVEWLVRWLNMADLSREWFQMIVAWDQLIQTVHSHSSYSRKRKDTHCAQQLDVVAVVYIIMAKAMKNSHNNGTV